MASVFDRLPTDCVRRIHEQLSLREQVATRVAVGAFRVLPENPKERLARRIVFVVRHYRRHGLPTVKGERTAVVVNLVDMNTFTFRVHLDHRSGPNLKTVMNALEDINPTQIEMRFSSSMYYAPIATHKFAAPEWTKYIRIAPAEKPVPSSLLCAV